MSANPKYKPNFYRQRAEWDYLVSANHFSTETFKSCFMFENEMLEEGYPRNDILSAPDRDERAIELKKKLGIPQDKKTILYAPTLSLNFYMSLSDFISPANTVRLCWAVLR